jgi:hypothetical protein
LVTPTGLKNILEGISEVGESTLFGSSKASAVLEVILNNARVVGMEPKSASPALPFQPGVVGQGGLFGSQNLQTARFNVSGKDTTIPPENDSSCTVSIQLSVYEQNETVSKTSPK